MYDKEHIWWIVLHARRKKKSYKTLIWAVDETCKLQAYKKGNIKMDVYIRRVGGCGLNSSGCAYECAARSCEHWSDPGDPINFFEFMNIRESKYQLVEMVTWFFVSYAWKASYWSSKFRDVHITPQLSVHYIPVRQVCDDLQ